jgi:ABC-type multidrug transport system ATPase subunit
MPAISFQSVSKNYPSTRNRSVPGVRALDDVSFDIQAGEFFGLLGPNGAGKTSLISILAGLSRATTGTVTVHGSDVVTDYAAARRKLGVVAQALVHKPQVIVLDEPTAGVDVELRQTLWQFIAKLNKQGSTVLLTTHYLEEAEALCSRIAMLKQGRVVALAQTSELLKSASSNVLRFKIDSELPKALADKARITGRIVQLPAHNANEIEHYLSAIREAGLVAEDVEIRKADLEDVFLEVMAEKIGTAGVQV